MWARMSVCHSGDLPLKGLDLCLPSSIPPSQRMEIGLLDLANKNIECSVQIWISDKQIFSISQWLHDTLTFIKYSLFIWNSSRTGCPIFCLVTLLEIVRSGASAFDSEIKSSVQDVRHTTVSLNSLLLDCWLKKTLTFHVATSIYKDYGILRSFWYRSSAPLFKSICNFFFHSED